LLAALSELKKNEPRPPKSENITQAKSASASDSTAGIIQVEGGPVGTVALTERNNSFIPLLDLMAAQREQNRQKKQQEELKAEQPDITAMRPDRMYQIGKSLQFDPHEVEIDAENAAEIRRIAVQLRGYNNIIEIRGHAATLESEYEGEPRDVWALSYERARRVMQQLISPELGVSPQRIKISTVGHAEPIVSGKVTHGEQRVNRRVEVLLVNHLSSQTVRTSP
jgi:outer membrane protein OmpA-like peptidoglycan-associated protein